MTPLIKRTPSQGETSIHIQKTTLLLARLVWVSIVLLTLPVFIHGILRFYQRYNPTPDYIAIYFANLPLSPQLFPIVLVISECLAVLVFWLVAIVIYVRRSDNAVVFASSITLLTSSVSVFSTMTWSGLPGYEHFIWLMADLTRFIGNTFILLVLYTFPDGRFVPRWTGILFVLSVIYIFMFLATFEQWNVWFGIVTRLIVFLFPILIIQPYRYQKVSNATQRQQTKWILLAFIVAVFAFFIYEIIPLIFPALENGMPLSIPYRIFAYPLRELALASIPIGLGIAVMRFRLWDVDLTINRSLVYGIVTIGLIALFVVNFFIFQSIFAMLLPGSQNVIGAGIAGAINFAAYQPVRRRVRKFIDRRFYGFRFDLDQLKVAQRSTSEILNRGYYTGQVIEGYELQGLIGRGGMGEIYAAASGDDIVAIKVLPVSLASESEYQQRFEREGAATAALNHPNIVKVLGRGQTAETVYLILEYIPGIDLRTLIQQNHTLSLADTCAILQGIVNALDYAHSQQVIHRDLKPSNIMMPKNPANGTYQPILMDFGLARFVESSTSLTGSGAIGTIDYMSPEQILEARSVDHRADIYSLGILTFEMLSGKRPFEGSPGHIMFAHLQQPAPDLRSVNPDVPETVAEAIQKAMSKQAEDRFNSAGEFFAALQL